MSANWLYNVKHVAAGEPVQAGVVNRPDRTLTQRTDYLKERLDAAELGRAIFESDATISPDVLEGHAVYWNWTTNRYERAIVAVEQDATTAVFTTQPSSECVGICFKKKAADRADIVLRGLVVFDNLTNSIGETVAPGKYYLSAVEPGKLSKQKPPVTVVVCHVQGPRDNCSDSLRVLVMPQTRDYVEEHTHYRFDLIPRPAGVDTILTDDSGARRHQIDSPDDESQGWLPADHPTFRRDPDDPTTNFAPPGAIFGYNIKKHEALNRVWPPIPIQSVTVLWDKGVNSTGATEIPLGRTGLAICDVNGIWWTSSCVGEVPWPDNYDPETSFPDGAGDECDRIEIMRVVVIYLRMLVGNDRSAVTSLVPDTDIVDGEIITSPVAITNCDDLPASTGDLKLNVDLQTVETPEPLGGQVLKSVTNRHQLFRGWVTEGVVTATPTYLNIRSSRAEPRALTADEKTALGISAAAQVDVHQGLVRIDYNATTIEREIAPQIIRLSDTVERLYMDIPYLGFPPAQNSLLRIRLNVPDEIIADQLTMKIRVQFFGRGGTEEALPDLYMSRRVLSRPVGDTALALPNQDTSLEFVVGSPAPGIDTVIERHSEEFQVSSGDTVLITVERRGNDGDDAYTGDVGVLRIAGIVTAAP